MLAVLVASGHIGVVRQRTGPEPSDLALFACACLGVWIVRRTLRRRLRRD